jgi:hypothetical protein
VAKKPKDVQDYVLPERHWRLSFRSQERQLIANKGKTEASGSAAQGIITNHILVKN